MTRTGYDILIVKCLVVTSSGNLIVIEYNTDGECLAGLLPSGVNAEIESVKLRVFIPEIKLF